MKRLVFGLIVACAGLFASAAHAERPEFYGNVGYTKYRFSDVDGKDSRSGGAVLRLGVNFNPYVGIEGETDLNFGSEDSSSRSGISLNHSYGLFGRVGGELGGGFGVFGRLGYATVDREIGIGSASIADDGSESAAAYGVGLQWLSEKRFGVRLDYTRYEFDNLDVDNTSVTFVFHH